METHQKEARKYELMLAISGQLADTEIEKALENIKATIAKRGGEVFYEDKWGRRNLAYHIRKETTGFYVVLNFLYASENIRELDRTLQLDNSVLRYILIAVPSGYQVQRFDIPVKKEAEEEKKPALKEIPQEARIALQKEAAPSEVGEEPLAEEKEERKKLASVEEKLRDIISDKDLNL